MACFLVPAAEAIITTALTKVMQSKEPEEQSTDRESLSPETGIPFSRKLKWLSNLLWGGSALLAFEHIWHGEVVPWFPFLTAAGNPASAAKMLREMAAAGTAMAVLITLVWGIMLAAAGVIEKNAAKPLSEIKQRRQP